MSTALRHRPAQSAVPAGNGLVERITSKKRTGIITFLATPASTTVPAHAGDWGTNPVRFYNYGTQACLTEKANRAAGLGDCDDRSAARWQMRTSADSGLMFRNVESGRCLDTNGADVCLGDCGASDLGQRWYFTACGDVSSAGLAIEKLDISYPLLAGWNAGTVSVVPHSREYAGKTGWDFSLPSWGCRSPSARPVRAAPSAVTRRGGRQAVAVVGVPEIALHVRTFCVSRSPRDGVANADSRVSRLTPKWL
ncbi:hypothetical protein ACFWVP_01260 [Streptomyces sp. NPDC058637]|uniref:RICIN domain-containing protein n=1 Tax=Streptomyces sp. NPDC058637 TaxID=3346569 RepID=UPI003652EC79